jgi:hypothetical protein
MRLMTPSLAAASFMTFSTLCAAALLCAVPASTHASASKTPIPEVTFQLAAKDVRGDSAVVRVVAVVPKGWHIQSNAPLDDFLIPTELKADGEGLRFGKAAFPKPLIKEFPALGGKVALFEDTIRITVAARGAKGKFEAKEFAKALEKSTIALRYQACNDSQCLPPKTVTAKFVR